MVTRRRTRVDTSDHDDLTLVRVQEGVTEDHSELGCAERHMRAARVQSSDTLLEGQQTGVDRGTLHTSLAIVALTVCSTF